MSLDADALAGVQVMFHFNVANWLDYVCRLVRKARLQRMTVMIMVPEHCVADIDQALWGMGGEAGFMAHALAQSPEATHRWSQVCVGTHWLANWAHAQVVINCGVDAVAAGTQTLQKWIEVVSTDAADRQSARQRWMHYRQLGIEPMRHDVAVTGG